jgi:hypothetical protein
VSSGGTAAAWTEQQIASVRDDPPGRIALMQRCYYGPFGKAPRHLPFRRAAMSFMQWQLRRGLLQRPLGPLLGDPRLGMTGIFLQLSRVLPDEYPLNDSVRSYLGDELGFGRLLDYGVIAPRLQQLYEWSARELAAPGLLDCIRDGALTYAWPVAELPPVFHFLQGRFMFLATR